jgi:hypothetical protein
MTRSIAAMKTDLTPASAALDRVAEALFRVEDRLRHVESAISHVVGAMHSLGRADIWDFQALDRSLQEINALATFTRVLASEAPVGWKLDLKKATDTLTLDSIRALIAGKAPVEAGRDMDEGEFELF